MLPPKLLLLRFYYCCDRCCRCATTSHGSATATGTTTATVSCCHRIGTTTTTTTTFTTTTASSYLTMTPLPLVFFTAPIGNSWWQCRPSCGASVYANCCSAIATQRYFFLPYAAPEKGCFSCKASPRCTLPGCSTARLLLVA